MKNNQIKTIAIALTAFVLSTTLSGQSFRHTAAGGNISGHITYLDHALTNNLPNKLLFVSQEWGSAGPYNPHTVGVWYSSGKWTIFNQDLVALPQQTKFNVLALDPGEKVFLHTATSATISGHITTLNHPLLNNNPNARILVTQNWGNAGPYNKNAVGVYYTGSRWAIYNQNRMAMPVNAKFNILIDDRIFVVEAAAPTSNWYFFDNPATNNQPNALVFVTQYWTNIYNTHEVGTWYSSNRWSVFNEDQVAMPVRAKFFVYVPGGGTPPTTLRMTNFNPTLHGFKFVNDFQVEVRVAQINGPRFGGQCGGMAYAALDYFKSGRTIPSQTYRPANGTTLQSYIQDRQLNSLGDNADKWIELFTNPFGWRTAEFFNWGIQGFNGGRLQELREAIDGGNPIPLGLFKGGNGGVGPHHQVLAIGYDMGRYTGDLGSFKEDLKIFIHDPNHPNETVTLRPNPGSNSYSYEQYPNEAWMTYFVDRKYSLRIPPVISTTTLPNNEIVGELLLEIGTGGDDLRGGNDNVNAIVKYTDGTSDTYANINRSAAWIGFYNETVPVRLRRTAPLNQIRSVTLITTFGGGLFGDNWNMDKLRIIARSGNNEREVYNKRGAPLVRFNGSNTPFEAVFTY